MWTKSQQKAIENKGKNILVSAAAGSGKTAVLTERILTKIVSGETQADRLVIVTFTKAAAAEMRERIRKGLEARYKEDPSNKVLFVQMTLLGDADICTIDSFCNKIVKMYFEEAGIDPAFRIPEEAEISLLKSDIFGRVIEEFYKEGDEDFFEFVSAFSSAKNDHDIEMIINNVYEESQNKPWPDEWLEMCIKTSEVTDPKESVILKAHLERIKSRLDEYITGTRAALDMICDGSGLEKYKPFMEGEVNELSVMRECDDLYGIYKRAGSFSFSRLPSAAKGCDEELKALCKGLRDAYKSYVTGIAAIGKDQEIEPEEDFFLGGRISRSDAQYISRQVSLIVRITRSFAAALEEEKKKRNIATFADIEHMALDILTERKDGVTSLTDAAEELKRFYDEILTDEYQDSNELQEEILNAISTGSNRYMVGDVKQSIYGFRGGDPHIFTGKYDRFLSGEDVNGELIILQNNFRSRAGVLKGCNRIFESIMNKEYTGISYDESESLVPSMEFGEYERPELTWAGKNGRIGCELIICDKDELREREYLEAVRISELIKEMFREGRKVYDAKKKSYRDICFKDIVVLCRRLSTCEQVAETLNTADIPAFAESRSSYMDTYEIRPVISFLKVIDNPLDDVAFAALMLSFFGGFDADELARLRSEDKDEFLYKCLLERADEGTGLGKKTAAFLKTVHEYREEAAHLSVYDLLWRIIYETGYYSYVGSIPSPKRRLANIDLLLSRAYLYTGTSYNGLFQFLRYVEKLEENDKARGEISAVSELTDAVRVMTIHKSKGLEFPAVFLAGMGKLINLRDASDIEKIVINEDSIVTDVYDTNRRVKRVTAFKKSVQAQVKREVVSEEIRLLYVAMTRAVEKLYLIGTYSPGSKGGGIENAAGDAYIYKVTGKYGVTDLDASLNYFKMTLPVILSDVKSGSKLFELKETATIDIKDPEDKPFAPERERSDAGKEDELSEDIKKYKDFVYPYESEINEKPKVTVTELKKMSYADEAESALDYRAAYKEAEPDTEYASFSDFNELSVKSAAGRGTQYHKLLEHLDLNKCSDESEVLGQIELLTGKGILQNEAKSFINAKDIVSLAESGIGKRIAAALALGKCKREQQFMMGTNVKGRSDELLVQGVIDLWFEEPDGLVVVDYKTDRVNKKTGDKVLRTRYSAQLEIYAEALAQATGKKVKECIIYSFALGRGVKV